MTLDRFQIAPLVGTLGLNGLAAKRSLAAGFGETSQSDVGVADQHAQHAVQVSILKLVTGAMEVVVVGK